MSGVFDKQKQTSMIRYPNLLLVILCVVPPIFGWVFFRFEEDDFQKYVEKLRDRDQLVISTRTVPDVNIERTNSTATVALANSWLALSILCPIVQIYVSRQIWARTKNERLRALCGMVTVTNWLFLFFTMFFGR